jgi:hypothetical protein
MAKKFYGVIVPYDTIKDWYLDRADFSSFIFQQQRDTKGDSEETNDKNYTLITYPVDVTGALLKGASIIDGLAPATKERSITRKLVNHANMKLERTVLNHLYHGGRISDLFIYPRGYYTTREGTPTDYMAYEAITYSNQQKALPIRRDLNPSPPA